MKIIKGIKIGGLQQKIFNLMLIFILALIGTYVAVSTYQERLKAKPEKFQFHDRVVQLQPGDVLFQYTDGVTEATDANEKLFGDARLIDAMNSAASTDPEKLLPHVRQKIDEFVKDAEQFDDITMLGMRYNGIF